MKFKNLAIINLSILSIPLIILLLFAWIIPTSSPEIIKKADAIVVLTGSAGRIQSGVDLLENGAADKMFISGVWKGAKVSEVLKGNNIKNPDILDNIVLGYEATSTRENAIEVKKFLSKNNYKTIYLVTASYHIPRAKLLFSRQMPDIKIIAYPAFAENFKEEKIFTDEKTAQLFFSEFLKYIATFFNLDS